MDVEKVLHMNGGIGQSSYASNSLAQRTMIEHAKQVVEESINGVIDTLNPMWLMMADMGCGCGPNALLVVSQIMDMVNEACRSLNRLSPQVGVFLNDLPGNDFNALFQLLPSLQQEEDNSTRRCFISATPKSYYGRVFPDHFLHFVHSSYSLHWLSQVPKGLVNNEGVAMNKGNIHIAKTSPEEVHEAYYKQFAMDFTIFLRSRALEIVPGGRMVLTFQGSVQSNYPNPIFGPLASALQSMVLEGIIEEEKLDKFNMPCYFPTMEEVRQLIEAEQSFTINKLDSFTVDWSVDVTQNLHDRVEFVVKSIRSVMESLFSNTFGEGAMDDLFMRFKDKVEEPLANQASQYINVLVSMTRRDPTMIL